jgi:hypothetical protein
MSESLDDLIDYVCDEWAAPAQPAPQRQEDATDDQADAIRFRWLCDHPDWHFVEHLCREFVADSSREFLSEMRRVIDARRSVELGPFEEHMRAPT